MSRFFEIDVSDDREDAIAESAFNDQLAEAHAILSGEKEVSAEEKERVREWMNKP